MKTLTLRTLIINSRHRRLPLQPLHTALLFHSRAAVEETLRRRSSSSSSSAPPPSSPSKQKHYHHHDEESKAVRVLVWWDFENCSIPGDVNPSLVGPRIMSALRSNGVRGPVSITAVGDVLRLARQTQDALSATGVSISHIPSGGQITVDRTLLIDLLCWVSQNPPPAHLFLISGDKGFAGVLHRLRMNNYNILLASNEGTSSVLFSTASIMWPWTSLVKGENLIGKHFNNPPDGIYGSWYGHYKGPLDDPFSETEHLTCTTSESLETAMDSKPHPIPRVIVNKIRDILYWYPDGASFSDLWLELKRSNIVIDRDFFGHKHFSRFLLSMPNILQIRRSPSGDGEPLVYGTHKKLSSYVEANLKPPPGVGFANGDMDPRMPTEQNGKSMPAASRLAFGKHSLAHETAPLNVKSAQVAQQPLVEGHTPIFNETTTDKKAHFEVKPMQVAQQPVVEEHTLISKEDAVGETVGTRGKEYDPRTEGGLLKKLWRKWFDNKTTDTVHWMDSSNGNKLTSVGDDRTCAGSTKSVADEKAVKLNDIQDQSNSCLVSEGTKPVFDHDIRGGTVKPEDESGKGLFNRIVKWCRFWRNDTESGEHKSESFHQVVNDEVKMKPETHDLFSKDHFWDSMESFLHTAKGSSLISRSESRERLATELQKEGPLVLNALKPNHLLKLVDILISDKKWVEENASQPSPFKLTFPPKSSNAPSQDVSSRGLSSFFSNRSKSNFQRNSDYNRGKEHNNPDLIGNSNAKLPQNMSELIAWFSRIDDGPGNIQAEDFKMYYERDFNKKLDTGLYGFSSVENLLEACLSDNASTPRSSGGRPPRAQILLDCQKLLAEILEKNPNGFNISGFRSLFAERYGYVLDHQALGYRKLLSLLRIMPGVKVYADFIFPARALHMKTSDSEGEIAAVSAGDSEHEDNSWEELGPISDKGVSEKREQSRVDDSSVQSIEDYEPSLCEEDFSGSEGESPISVDQLEEQKQKGRGKEDSSLLQILDSWYSNKDGSGKNAVVDVSSVKNSVSKPIDPLVRNLDFQRAVTNRGRKPKRRKTYSFVLDDEKEKLVDGILGSLKRSAGS